MIKTRDPLHVQISDWGISSSITQSNWQVTKAESEGGITSYGAGSPLYMSPERFSGQWKIAPQADIYALGIMLLQIVSGILPFRLIDRNPYEEILSGSYMKNAQEILHGRSEKLSKIVLSCINPDIEMRPKTYDDLIIALSQCH